MFHLTPTMQYLRSVLEWRIFRQTFSVVRSVWVAPDSHAHGGSRFLSGIGDAQCHFNNDQIPLRDPDEPPPTTGDFSSSLPLSVSLRLSHTILSFSHSLLAFCYLLLRFCCFWFCLFVFIFYLFLNLLHRRLQTSFHSCAAGSRAVLPQTESCYIRSQPRSGLRRLLYNKRVRKRRRRSGRRRREVRVSDRDEESLWANEARFHIMSLL